MARDRLDSTMHITGFGQDLNLSGIFSTDSELDKSVQRSMDGFLESVEKRAYVMALAACRDQQNALDIVQDSMFSMVKNYSHKPPEQWPPLFYRVLNNRITDQHRKRGFGRLAQWFGHDSVEDEPVADAVDQLPTDEFSPENVADSSELGHSMEKALANLSLKQQQALILRHWQGLSVKETAIAMNISEGSVKTHLSRAVHEMREQLQEFRPND